MNVQLFTWTFLLAVAAHLAVQIWLAHRQVSFVESNRGSVPEEFAAVVRATEHQRAANYEIAGQRLGVVESILDVVALLVLTVGGGIAATAAWSRQIAGDSLLGGTLHLLLVFAFLAALGLPISVYRTFVLEERFGFNRTTPATFVSDRIKGWTVGLVLGGALAFCVLWVMSAAGHLWWLVGWGVWLSFTLLATWAWPRLIAPIFNKFSPLEDVELRGRIEALLTRCGFHAKAVFVMDGSRRSSHGNAYFTGVGREKRIVFFDTLLATLSPAQVESVLAHELAHFKLRHVPQRLVAVALLGLAGFALLGWLADREWFYSGLGVPVRSDSSALLLFLLVLPAFTWIVTPALAAWSRRHEYEADAYAAEHSDGQALADALVKLYKDNATTLTPDPVYSAFHDSHPPPAMRILRLVARARAAA